MERRLPLVRRIVRVPAVREWFQRLPVGSDVVDMLAGVLIRIVARVRKPVANGLAVRERRLVGRHSADRGARALAPDPRRPVRM